MQQQANQSKSYADVVVVTSLSFHDHDCLISMGANFCFNQLRI